MGMAAAAVESQFHVLAVDDSLIDRKLIERLLKTSSYQVTTVDSGSKALEFLGLHEEEEEEEAGRSSVSSNHHQEVHVNLVITDYCMPGMTGYDLLKRIKESSSLRNIPVVIMSSENVPSRISRCLEEGAEEFFLKPVRLSDLNKLKPHIMKTKFKDQNRQQSQPKGEESYKSDAKSPSQPQQQPQQLQQLQQQQEEESYKSDSKSASQMQQQQPQESQQLPQQQQQPEQQSNNNNKRKALEEELSPERTRPRYNGITTVV